LIFEAEFEALYNKDAGILRSENKYGETNVYIPGGGKEGGEGFADIVLYVDGGAQIYEIKPQSYYDDSKKKQDGEDQLNRYIKAYNKNNNNSNNTSAIKGKI